MAVAQAHALARDRRHGRRGGVVDHARAQAVGDEQHHIVRLRALREGGCPQGELQDCGTEEK